MATLRVKGIDATTGQEIFASDSDIVANNLNVGSGITASADVGDIVAGDGTRELDWDASENSLSLTPPSGSNTTTLNMGLTSSYGALTISTQGENTGAPDVRFAGTDGSNGTATTQMRFDAGNQSGSGSGGSFFFTSGDTGSGGSAGGGFFVRTGDNTSNAAFTEGTFNFFGANATVGRGAQLSVTAGNGTTAGGPISFITGDASTGTAGGSMTLQTGAGTSTGGRIIFRTNGANTRWEVDGDGLFIGGLEATTATLTGRDATTAATAGAALTITAGDGNTTGAGGALTLDAGSSPSGTDGTITIGGTNASAITIGTTAIDTTIRGGAIFGAASGTTDDGDIRAGDGTREMLWDTSAGSLGITGVTAAGALVNAVGDANGSIRANIQNDNTGASALTEYRITADTAIGQVVARSSSAGVANEVLFNANNGPATFGTGTADQARIRTSGVNRWAIGASDGHLTAVTDDTYDFGASGATRPRTVYIGTSLNVGDATALTGTGDFVAGSSDTNRVSWDDSLGALSVSLETTATNDVETGLQVARQTSNTAAAGFGVDMEWAAENGSGGVLTIATAEAVFSDVTAASETADFNIYAISGGSSTELLNLSGSTLTARVNDLPLPSVLASVTGVDLTSTGDNTLYTVPTGQSAVVTGVFIRPTTATAANGDAVISIGTNVTRDDIFTATTLTGLDATTESYVLTPSGIIHVAAATEIIRLEVDTAETGTALTATVELIGYLV